MNSCLQVFNIWPWDFDMDK